MKILDVIDYIFYRMCKFILAHNFVKGDEDEKRVGAIAIYCLMFIITINFLITVPILRANNIRIISKYTDNGILLFALIILQSIPFYIRYWKRETYKRFNERWKDEDPKQYKTRGWLIWILVITTIFLIPSLVIVLEHYGIL